MWYEVSIDNTAFHGEPNRKWYIHNKGGNFRKWYGNREYLINWENDGDEIRNFKDDKGKLRSRPQNIDSFFIEGISWSDLTAGKFSARYYPSDNTFDATGPTIPFKDNKYLKYVLGYMNTPVFQMLLDITCPGIHYNNGVITGLPIDCEESILTTVEMLVTACIDESKKDWDSFEISWDFQEHPFARYSRQLCDLKTTGEAEYSYFKDYPHAKSPLEICFLMWQEECEKRFVTLKKNKEQLNGLFIDLYHVSKDVSPDVEDKYVTIHKANLKSDVKAFISYSVGCMFGRYSVNYPGLIYAGGKWDETKYVTFQPDKDGIIPICDDEYFEDDIVGRLADFLITLFGEDTLEDNLRYIAEALEGKGSSRDVIRNYFLNDFYSDHCAMCSSTSSGKRPFYWLFDSGKKNGFKCLIYLHRYQPDTIARIRTDYVHEQQSRYRTAIADLESRIANAGTGERVKLTKQLKTLQDQAEEIRVYEEKIHHLADQMIKIDLDDGVKVNYAKFQDVLAKIK